MSFNEESAMPEHVQGHVESAIKTIHRTDDAQPSVQSTDRYGLQANNKGYLLRKYNIEISKAGNPYFTPIPSLLNAFVRDADGALAEARARVTADPKLQERIDTMVGPCSAWFDTLIDDGGEGREWLARSLCIWPLTNQIGYHLYKACSGEADVCDYAAFLLDTDANVNSQSDLDSHEQYQKRQFWTDLAYDELGVVDALIREVDPDSIDYNLQAVIRNGYQASAGKDTKDHLRGNTGNAPVTSDVDREKVKAQILASRRIASSVV
jgi:hypothetical protein